MSMNPDLEKFARELAALQPLLETNRRPQEIYRLYYDSITGLPLKFSMEVLPHHAYINVTQHQYQTLNVGAIKVINGAIVNIDNNGVILYNTNGIRTLANDIQFVVNTND